MVTYWRRRLPIMASELLLSFALLCVTGLYASVVAQTIDQQWKWCAGADPDLSIGGCTAVIQSGQQTTENLAIAFYNRGFGNARKGQYGLAIQDFGQSIRLNPNDPAAFGNRGFAFAALGQYDRAIQDYDVSIQLNPKDYVVLGNRGLAFAALGQYDRAVQDYGASIQLNPNDGRAFDDRGLAFAALGQYDRAIQDYDQA